MKTSEPSIIVEETYHFPKEIVWKAITDKKHMQQWFFEQIKDFKPEVGFKTEFMVQSESRQFPHHWEVTEVIPNEKITCLWKFPTYTGASLVTFQLTDIEKSTTLTLTAEAVEDFPDDIPEFKRESGVAGWNYFIKERLKEFLD